MAQLNFEFNGIDIAGTAGTVLTLPSATDTLVGRASTDTLTNKTINGANNTLTVRLANDITGFGTGVATFLATPSSANLAAAITDETGSGALVFATSPTLTTPNIGVATGTSFNSITGLSSTNPAALGTVAVGTGTTVARADHVHPTTGVGLTSGNLGQFASTTSSQLAGVISDETGSGALVFATSPTLVTPNIGVATGTSFNSITGLSSTTPSANGTAAVGTGTTVARADHVHPISALTIGTGLSGSSYNGSSAVTIAIDSTVATLTGTQTLTNKTLGSGGSGGATLGANLAAGTYKITGLGTPTAATDAATKQYVDDVAQGLHVHPSVVAATTSALTATYSNGSSGVGATLTNSGALAAFSIDGVSPAQNDRVLVKNQAAGLQNGIYTLTTVGSGSVAWILTRATDMDESAEVDGGDFVFVTGGTVNDNTGWVQTEVGVVIGTNALSFSQFSGAGTYTAGNGLTLNGNQFTINTAITADLTSVQTLTNKTLTSPTITNPTVSGLYLSDNNIIIEGTNDIHETTLVFTDPTVDRTITFPNADGTVVLNTNNLSVFASTTSSQLAGVISDETGSGALVFATSPTLVTPNIGVATGTSFNSITALSSTAPAALGTATTGTSTTVARADHVHPTTGLGLTSGTLAQFAATTSSQLAGVISDETGSGALVFATSPTLVTPNIGVATGTSFNSITGLSSTTPAALGTAAVGTGTTTARADHVHPTTGLVTTVNGSSGAITNVALTTGNLGQFAATTSSQLAGVISDETGSGALVFATSPTLVTPNIGVATGTSFNSITGLSSTTPSNLGTAAVGTATTTARADHVHGTTGLGLTASGLSQFASTTSSQLAGVISDETGTGSLVFGTSPTISSAILTGTLTAGGGTGTNGQVLTSTGTGVQWAAAGGGGADEIMVIMGAY